MRKIQQEGVSSKYYLLLCRISQNDNNLTVVYANILDRFLSTLFHLPPFQKPMKFNVPPWLLFLPLLQSIHSFFKQWLLWCIQLGIYDVINNNKPLEQKPALTQHMQLRRNYISRLDSSFKQSYQTDNPPLSSSSPLPLKEEETSTARTKLYWNEHQERVFLEFWIEKLTQDPLKIYSFDNPLKRSHYFSELSRYLADNLGSELGKADQQCKSKFATIRRKIQKDKLKGKLSAKYGFIDYIIEQARRRLARFPYMIDSIQRLEELRDNDSHFMIMTKKMLDFERREQVMLKNNAIYAYLVELGQMPLIIL